MSEIETENNTTRVWWQRLVELAALIALPPTLAYAFGVVALWVQLSTLFLFSDAWTYWYAATLAPKPLVAGLGVRVLLRGLSLSLLIGGVSLLVAWPFVRQRRKRLCSADHGPPRLTLVIPVSSISIGLFLVTFSFFGHTAPTVPNLRVVGVPILVYLVISSLPWILSAEQRSLVKLALDFYPRALYGVFSLVGILLVVLFMLFPGKDLQLPCLERELSEDGAFKVEGRLVAHTDGYWWVFDENGDLTAIPNDGQTRFEVEEPVGKAISPSESSYSGPYEKAPENPIKQCL